MTAPVRAAAALVLAAGPAFSGALDRTGQPIDPLFEPGGYAELSFGRAWPDVSGEQVIDVPPFPAGAESGDVTESFTTFGLAVKRDFTDRFSGAVIYDQPFGADLAYPNEFYFAQNSTAEVDSNAVTALLRYRFGNGVSVHGGLRYQTLEGSVGIPFVGGSVGLPYALETDRDEGLGYVAGVAYEIPDIALRVALTYSSEIDHELPGQEVGPFVPGDTTLDITTPESIRLDFQSGIATDTLLFGSIRWADWSEFTIEPERYVAVTGGPLLFYPDDITTYTLGLGRRFTERFSGAVSLAYEDQSDDLRTNLGPTSGVTSIGLAGTYDLGDVEITGAVQYGWLGDARSQIRDPASGQIAQVSQFEDNNVVAVGLQLAYRF